jgi:hypothetical protein
VPTELSGPRRLHDPQLAERATVASLLVLTAVGRHVRAGFGRGFLADVGEVSRRDPFGIGREVETPPVCAGEIRRNLADRCSPG